MKKIICIVGIILGLTSSHAGWNVYTSQDMQISSDIITTLNVGPDNRLWVGTEGEGIGVFDGNDWMNISTLLYEINSDNISAIINLDQNPNSFLVGNDNGATTLTETTFVGGGTETFIDYNVKQVFENFGNTLPTVVTALYYESSSALWFGSTDGVFRYNGAAWQEFLPDTIISNVSIKREIKSITSDTDGKIWCATNLGVYHYTTGTWSNFNDADGLPSTRTNALCVNNGTLWCGTDQGIAFFNGNSFITVSNPDGENAVISLFSDSYGNIWIGTLESGLFRFDGSNWFSYGITEGLPANKINCIAVDNQGIRWFGTDNGLARFENDAPSLASIDDQQVQVNDLLSVQLLASDLNGDFVSVSVTQGPAGMGINSSNELAWTPGWDDLGSHQIELTANDGCGGIAIQTFQVDVEGLVNIVRAQNIPDKFSFHNATYNEFNKSISFEIGIPKFNEEINTKLRIMNSSGRMIKVIDLSDKAPGYHTILWNQSRTDNDLVSTGLYICQLVTNNFSTTKTTLLR